MAFISQERKAKLAPAIKAVLKKYRIKGSLAVHNNLTLVLNIKSGPVDFFESFNRIGHQKSRPAHLPFTEAKGNIQVNTHHFQNHFDGTALKFMSEVIPLMNAGNHDNSDIMSDYFDVGWYVDVNIGKWNQPYVLEASVS